jgi:hypothetical protein
MKYRIRETGEVKTQGEIRRLHPSTSFPRVWTDDTCEFIGIDPVLLSPKPEVTNLQQALADGVEQDALSNWVEKWIVADKFNDYTDEDGVAHTKAEQETAFLQGLDDAAFEALRTERNRLLAETDWTASTDVTMSFEMIEYRQSLRDMPADMVDVFIPVYPIKPNEIR